jgi:hypothetical protein
VPAWLLWCIVAVLLAIAEISGSAGLVKGDGAAGSST